MTGQRRPAFTRLDVLLVLALLGLLLAVGVPALLRARLEAKREQSADNLKRLVLATHDYADHHERQLLPLGCDDNGFSVVAKILPYLGQEALYKRIDFSKPISDPVNEATRRTRLDFLLSPLDDQPAIGKDPTKALGPTNYLFNALVFNRHWCRPFPSGIPDGTSQTVFVAETLRGDGSTTAYDVRRQHIALPVRPPLARGSSAFPDDLGVSEFKQNRNVAANRGASWMDGGHLQGTFLPGRMLNDERPDVVVGPPGKMEGLSGPRSLDDVMNVAMGDGTVIPMNPRTMTYQVWYARLTPDGEVFGVDW
jgi:type II secretory pathway pseudopilin PulG